MCTRILLVDDHSVFIEGLRTILERESDMQVIGQVSDGWEAVKAVSEEEPDLVIMDLTMPDMNGIEATRQIVANEPDTKVLCLSMHDERRLVTAVFEAGATGYVLKDAVVEELIRAIRTVMDEQTYVSPSVAGPMVSDYVALRSKRKTSAFAGLSVRQRQMLQLLAEGHSTSAIAARLEVSTKTVGTHREKVMKKLGIRSVAGLTKYAIREGLTSVERDATR